jgi:hypothetical protein
MFVLTLYAKKDLGASNPGLKYIWAKRPVFFVHPKSELYDLRPTVETHLENYWS